MSKYLGKGQFDTDCDLIEEEIVPGRWRDWAIGIDIHKLMLICTVIFPDFVNRLQEKKTRRFETTHSDLDRMRDWLLEFKEQYGPTVFVIESTGTYHQPVCYALCEHFECILVNPALAAAAKKKSDKFDAAALAYHGMTGEWKVSYIVPDMQHQERVVNRRYFKAINSVTAATNAINSRLIDFNILFTREIKKVFSATGKDILEAIIEGIKDPKEVAERVRKYMLYRDKPQLYDDILLSLRDLPKLPDSARQIIAELYKQAEFFEQQSVYIHALLENLFQQHIHEYPDGRKLTAAEITELIITIHGVGSRFAETFITEMGIDLEKRFGNSDKAVAYAGFDPSKKVSADKVTSMSPRGGNVFMKNAAVQSAQAILQTGKRDDPLAKWGRSYKSRNGNSKQAHAGAVFGIAKRLITMTYHIVQKGEPYDGKGYDFTKYKTEAAKKLRRLAAQAADLKNEMGKMEKDDIIKVMATEVINTMSEISGLKGGFVLNADAEDELVINLPLKPRTKRVLINADITRISSLWFSLIQGRLMDIAKFGEKSYKEVVGVLIDGNFIKQLSKRK